MNNNGKSALGGAFEIQSQSQYREESKQGTKRKGKGRTNMYMRNQGGQASPNSLFGKSINNDHENTLNLNSVLEVAPENRQGNLQSDSFSQSSIQNNSSLDKSSGVHFKPNSSVSDVDI